MTTRIVSPSQLGTHAANREAQTRRREQTQPHADHSGSSSSSSSSGSSSLVSP